VATDGTLRDAQSEIGFVNFTDSFQFLLAGQTFYFSGRQHDLDNRWHRRRPRLPLKPLSSGLSFDGFSAPRVWAIGFTLLRGIPCAVWACGPAPAREHDGAAQAVNPFDYYTYDDKAVTETVPGAAFGGNSIRRAWQVHGQGTDHHSGKLTVALGHGRDFSKVSATMGFPRAIFWFAQHAFFGARFREQPRTVAVARWRDLATGVTGVEL